MNDDLQRRQERRNPPLDDRDYFLELAAYRKRDRDDAQAEYDRLLAIVAQIDAHGAAPSDPPRVDARLLPSAGVDEHETWAAPRGRS